MRQTVFVFFVFSFAGWLIELVFRSFYERRPVNPGFHKGPWLPLYGLSGTAIYLVSENLASGSIFIRIIFYYLLCTALEFTAGVFLERVFHRRYWDYSANRFNLMGLICPLYSAAWVLISLIVEIFIIPVMKPAAASIPQVLLFRIDVFMMFLFLIDFTVSSGMFTETRLRRMKDLFS